MEFFNAANKLMKSRRELKFDATVAEWRNASITVKKGWSHKKIPPYSEPASWAKCISVTSFLSPLKKKSTLIQF